MAGWPRDQLSPGVAESEASILMSLGFDVSSVFSCASSQVLSSDCQLICSQDNICSSSLTTLVGLKLKTEFSQLLLSP